MVRGEEDEPDGRYGCRVTDKANKKKILHSICIYGAFFSLGWIRGLYGPALIDILFISGVTLDLGSLIFTCNSIGYALGCIGGGYLADRGNRNILYGVSLILLGILIAATPWCYVFAMMVAVHFGQGIVTGIIDTVGNAEILSLWRDERMMFFFLELMFGTGIFVSPFVAAPFLLDKDSQFDASNDSFHEVIIPSHTEQRNITDTVAKQSSQLFIPYTITAFLYICLCVPFFIFCFLSKTEVSHEVETKQLKENDSLPLKDIAIFIVIGSSVLFLGMALGEGFISYLAVYCVDHLGFNTAEGAVISSISGGCSIAAVVVSLFASSLNTLVYLCIHIVGTLVGVAFFLIFSVINFRAGVWLFAGVIGYFRAMIFSLMLTWTNEYITPMTGKITSVYMVSTSAGCAIVPFLLGVLMETYTNLWLCYLFLILGTMLLVVYSIGIIFTKKIVTMYGKTGNRVKNDLKPETAPLHHE
ncbi:sodium-dependent glucose transporter 1A-like [Ylistrum balloti]|uniref:sodium-dependent glucose transporter 1A-like n=1 Tax=Ylistrum balloti TaxID=509963 RepID=UPI002905B707|nr:sodium-dependent glucose transporter 1A-like [Ylistrum balloti]